MNKINILVVDDSLMVRRLVTEEINLQTDMQVVGVAANGRAALEQAATLQPDLITLDIEMPEMDGLAALSHLRESHPKTPVIMFSSLTELGAAATLEALSRGASDFFAKPQGSGGLEASRKVIRAELIPAIRALGARKQVSPLLPPKAAAAPPPSRDKKPSGPIEIVAIGASTGGPNALAEVFAALPANLPTPIVVVQHMPPMFTQLLSERLGKVSKIPTAEAKPGMELHAGRAYVAPGDFHFVVSREGSRVVAAIHQELPENACRPAVDPLFRSVAAVYGANCLGIILTGMGQDGLRGSEAIVAAGGAIIAQDEATSIVWGMPGAVARAGLANAVLPLSSIAAEILRRLRGSRD